MNTSSAGATRLLQIASAGAMVLGLAMAFTAIANSMPSLWIIPKIGPFKAEFLRGGVLSSADTVVILARGFTRRAIEQEKPSWRHWLLIVLCWRVW